MSESNGQINHKKRKRPDRPKRKRGQVPKPHKFIDSIECKWCSKHQTFHPLKEFGKDKSQWDALNKYCKRYYQERMANDPIARRKKYEGTQRWRHKPGNQEKRNKRERKRCRGHNSAQNTRRRHRYATDINYRIRRIFRRRVKHALHGSGKAKKGIALLGCEPDYFKDFIQQQLTEKMTWDNHGHGTGKWVLDHIKPCDSFNLANTEEQKMCFHYTNIQVLSYTDNLRKGTKYNPEQDPRTWTGTEWSWGNTTRHILLFN